MAMVGSGHKDRIDLLVHRVEHPAVIEKGLWLGSTLGSLLASSSKAAIVHVRNRGQFFAQGCRQARLTSAAAADYGRSEP